MKIPTANLTGAALDWAVAKCEGVELYGVDDFLEQRRHTVKHSEYVYRWHQSWMQAGPIIERERIFVKPLVTSTDWRSYTIPISGYGAKYSQYGPTPLIAAMRCYVASKLGEEVDVPDELVKE